MTDTFFDTQLQFMQQRHINPAFRQTPYVHHVVETLSFTRENEKTTKKTTGEGGNNVSQSTKPCDSVLENGKK